METPALDTAVKRRPAKPTIPFIPGPETLIKDTFFKSEIPLIGTDKSVSSEIKVPSPLGFLVFLIKHGIWKRAIGAMVRGCKTLAPK